MGPENTPTLPGRLPTTGARLILMAKPNYKFEKRQRDLAKKKKRDAKRLRKTGGTSETAGKDETPQPPDRPSPPK